ncbi:hypothetical protein [Lentilactobacillus rapi]|uniref:hypothetical protein n=1 Tax=Lentilactobacillus rapi TaxID=481723 RepID=UPI000AED86FE
MDKFVRATEVTGGNSDQPTDDSIDTALLKDDLYKAVNADGKRRLKFPPIILQPVASWI